MIRKYKARFDNNKNYQIYIDSFSYWNITPNENNQIVQEVERYIAYYMTNETKYATNFLFNLERFAAHGKSTILKMYLRLLSIYWAEISKDAFSFKNKANQNDHLTIKHQGIYIVMK